MTEHEIRDCIYLDDEDDAHGRIAKWKGSRFTSYYAAVRSCLRLQGVIMKDQNISAIMASIIGLKNEEAGNITTDAGFIYRITKIDDLRQMMTNDAKSDRINVRLKNDIVVDTFIG